MGDCGIVGPVPTGTVTFLFTDVENSTALWDQQPVEMRMALERHDRILRVAMAARGGFVFSHGGDGVAVAFQRAGDAVAAAVEAQRVLLEEPWPSGVELRVRMGVHTGEADERDGDYFGPPLNRAARLMSAAHGGQILVSATTAEMLWSVTGIELRDLGSLELRGVSEPIHAFGVSAKDVPWVDREPTTVRTVVGNLPTPVNEWFGSVAELRRRFANLPHRRLVTLTGPGGVGKTRMALEAAAVAADEYGDGVWLVELAPVAEPGSVALAVAATLSIQPQSGMSVAEATADWLRDRRLLLVLDNCEHVLEAAGDLASAIVTRCRSVTVLATSREPLGVDGERVVPVAGLDTADAVDLFCDRVSAADDTVLFSAEDHAGVVATCEQLDGIPLAIELAAARVRFLTPTEIVERLGDHLALLRSTAQRGAERHRTLRATVDWSYQLLTSEEQRLFERLSVFAGEFDLRAVERVCAEPPLRATEMFDVLASLVDKSMVVADRGDAGTRYRLLETLRQFAAERLAEAGDTDAIRERHLHHYFDVAAECHRLWASPHQLTANAILDREWDNMRAAHAWALASRNVQAADQIVAGTAWPAFSRGRHEHTDWAQRTLELESAGLHPASTTYAWAAKGALDASENQAAAGLAERGIAAAPQPDHPGAAGCWTLLIVAHLASGRPDAAIEPARHLTGIEPALQDPVDRWHATRALIENALANDRESVGRLVETFTQRAIGIGAPSLLSLVAHYCALSALYAQEPRDAQSAFTTASEGVALARTVQDLTAEGLNVNTRAVAGVALHRPDAAEICRDAITLLYELRFWYLVYLQMDVAAALFATTDRLHEAAVIYGHLDAHHPPWGVPTAYRARQRGLDRIRQLPDVDLLIAQGADMDRDQLVAYTLERLEHVAEPQIQPA
jgi:predicted ATPase/class 3 adenylate cyclase